MQPRLKSSKKWTAFPAEYTTQIQKVFRENFANQLGANELVVEGRIYSEEILLRVGLAKTGQLRQANFEVSMDYSAEDKDALERIHNCVDAAASMMVEYFEKDGEPDFPNLWKPFPFQKRTVYLQFSTENSRLEAEADKILGSDDGALVQGDDETDDGDETDPRPSMFGGKKGGKLH